jgi:TPR repeat protein
MKSLVCRLYFGFAIFSLPFSAIGQDQPSRNGDAPTPSNSGESPQSAPAASGKDLFRQLVLSANGNDAKAADALTEQVLATTGQRLVGGLKPERIPQNAAAARELLAKLLLDTGSPALVTMGHSWLDRAVQDESVGALETQALILLNGSHGRERAPEQALVLLRRAKELPGASLAFFLLGRLAAEGIAMGQDNTLSLAYFREGAQADSIPCLVALHRLYREGDIIPRDLAEAEKLGRKASELGSAEAAYEMGLFFELFQGDDPKWDEAGKWLELASQRGMGGASVRLASYHLNGKLGDASDKSKAVALCRLAAEQGDAEACFLLSQLYSTGDGLPLDLVASTAWLRVAADRGHTASQNELGLRLAGGLGVPASFEEATKWFLQASKQGLPAALVNLGEIYQNGAGVERNLKEAMNYYEAAAKANHPGGQLRLALLLQSGAAGASDPLGAAYWMAKAAAQDQTGTSTPEAQEAVKQLKILRAALSPSQVGELDRRLRETETKQP